MDKSKIAILTTVANFKLYSKTAQLFPKNIAKFVIDGTNQMHGIDSIIYMIRKLKSKGIEWLIMADEDVIFSNSNEVFSIIDEMISKKITICGVRDGGEISHRNQNPYLINTFFSIINFKEVLRIWNKKEMLKNQYINKNEFTDDLSKLNYKFDVQSMYEPYYCFYVWLRRNNKKFLFLDAKMNKDAISNYVLYNDKPFLCHTWYARSYEQNKKHTKRIDILLEENSFINSSKLKVTPIIFKHKTFYIAKQIKRFKKKIMMKLHI